MEKLRQNQLTPFLIRIGSILGVFYVLFLLGRSVWTNYDLRESIKKLNEQIVTLEQQKKDMANLNLYYSSQSYKELEARRKLGYKKADEKVVLIAGAQDSVNFAEQLNADESKVSEEQRTETSANWLLWLDYFTGSVVK